MFGERRKYVVTEKLAGKRIDRVMVDLEPCLSRQYVQKLLKNQRITCLEKSLKASHIVRVREVFEVDYPKPQKMELEAREIPIKVIYEDEDLLVIDKAPGMVVHPGAQGQFSGETLVNALLAYVGEGLKAIGGVLRPGIVHRLDKDTSGLIVIAKNDLSHRELSRQFKAREVEKYYFTMVCGAFAEEHGMINLPIGRSQINRKLMSIDGIRSREAKTEYWVENVFNLERNKYSLLKIRLHTGRTHQIRAHMAELGHPLVGDLQYGRKTVNALFAKKFSLCRQFLHAYALKFTHPHTKKTIDLSINLPSDLNIVLEGLEKIN